MTYPCLILRFDWENHCQNLTKLKAVEKKGERVGGGQNTWGLDPSGGPNFALCLPQKKFQYGHRCDCQEGWGPVITCLSWGHTLAFTGLDEAPMLVTSLSCFSHLNYNGHFTIFFNFNHLQYEKDIVFN